MDFLEIANIRESCRQYDATRDIENEKLEKILNAAQLAPSACNGQPYHFTVCKGDTAKRWQPPAWVWALTNLPQMPPF